MKMHSLFNTNPELDIKNENIYKTIRSYIPTALRTPTTRNAISKVLDSLRIIDNCLYIGVDGYIISLGGVELKDLLRYLRQHNINNIICERSAFTLTGRVLKLSGLNITNSSDKHFLSSGRLELSGNSISLDKTTASASSVIIIESRSRLSIRDTDLRTSSLAPNSYIHLNANDYQLPGIVARAPNLIINHIIPLNVSDALKKNRDHTGFLESLPDSPFEFEELRNLIPSKTPQVIGINMLPWATELNPFRVTYYPAPASKIELPPRSLSQYSNKALIIRKRTSDYYIIY